VVVKADALNEPTQNFFVQLFDATGPYGPIRFKDGSAEAKSTIASDPRFGPSSTRAARS